MLDTIFKQILIPRTKIKCKISFPDVVQGGPSTWSLPDKKSEFKRPCPENVARVPWIRDAPGDSNF